jgi:hypothetical protein
MFSRSNWIWVFLLVFKSNEFYFINCYIRKKNKEGIEKKKKGFYHVVFVKFLGSISCIFCLNPISQEIEEKECALS